MGLHHKAFGSKMSCFCSPTWEESSSSLSCFLFLLQNNEWDIHQCHTVFGFFHSWKICEFLPATHPLSPCVLLSGFLYPVLLLFDLLLFSLALIFASVLYDFVGLKITKSSSALRSCKQIRTLLFNCNLLHIELPALLFPPKKWNCGKAFFNLSVHFTITFGWTSFSIALASSS